MKMQKGNIARNLTTLRQLKNFPKKMWQSELVLPVKQWQNGKLANPYLIF